jgi:DNA polymerase alpha subunit B
MCKVYGLSPQDLFFKYEAFLLSRPSGLRAKLSTFTLEVARELRKEVQRESQAKGLAASISTPNEKAAATIRRKPGTNGGDLGFLDGLSTPVRKPKTQPTRLSNAGNNANLPSPSGFTTPARPTAMAGVTPTGPTASSYRPTTAGVAGTPLGKSADSPAPLGARPPQPFHLRADPHTLLETFNAHLEAGPGAPGVKSRVALATTVETSEREYRYMFEKMSARSEALDEQIDDYGDVIREAYQLAELGDPAVTSEEEIYCVGRILAPPTDGAKANTANLFLQSSRMLSGGRVVALRFAPPGTLKVRGGASGVRGFGLFPGCIACLKGRNGGGGVFVVNEVLMVSCFPVSGQN